MTKSAASQANNALRPDAANAANKLTADTGVADATDPIRDILRRVADPEIGLNIVDLGLIYDIDDGPDGLRIELTMTSPACPMGDLIIDDMTRELAAARPDAPPPEIVLVWNPPWDPSMMTARGKATLGW